MPSLRARKRLKRQYLSLIRRRAVNLFSVQVEGQGKQDGSRAATAGRITPDRPPGMATFQSVRGEGAGQVRRRRDRLPIAYWGHPLPPIE